MPADIRVAGLFLFPLKSASAIGVWTAEVEREGLAGDRRMMVIDTQGECLTSRRFPTLLSLRCSLEGNVVVLSAPDAGACLFSRAELAPTRYAGASVWGEHVEVLDAGDLVAEWLSAYLGHPCRLAIKGERTVRPLTLGEGGFVSFADTAPLLLIGEASLADLNDHMEQPVEMARFRPNVVVRGSLPFDEDGWHHIRIGDVEFEVAGPCDRCVVTTLDPATGAARGDSEPLATLARHRRGQDGKPYFGQFLIPQHAGRIFIDDRIAVLSCKTPVALQAAPVAKPKPRRALVAQHAKGLLSLICTGVTRETLEMTTFRFQIQDGGMIDYRPGQFMTLLLDIDGETVRRNYTISSSPSRPHHLSVSVKRVAGGRVSNWLHDTLQPGDRVSALAPNGHFHLDAAGPSRKLLMLSAGSGVTPMISILRYIADLDLPYDVVFHHSARTYEDMVFADELASLRRQMHGRLHVSWNLTGAGEMTPSRSGVFFGRLNEEMLRAISPDIAERTTLCCGPAGFRSAAKALQQSLAPVAVFLEESFGADVDQPMAEVSEAYRVTFEKSGRIAEGNSTATVLELAREQGVALAADCEAGICGTCRCRVIEGKWRLSARCADRDRLALSDEEKKHGYVLACTTRPIGNVLIAL